jgi:hypothetical protein
MHVDDEEGEAGRSSFKKRRGTSTFAGKITGKSFQDGCAQQQP